MEPLLSVSAIALFKVGTDAIQIGIEGVIGNETHEVSRFLRQKLTQRLLDGAWELPENHDLRNAIENSVRDAARFLAHCLSIQFAPQKPLLTRLYDAWINGSLLTEPLIESLSDKERRWLKEFENAINRPNAFGLLRFHENDTEITHSLATLVQAESTSQLAKSLHEAMSLWLERNVQTDSQQSISVACRKWILEGWSPAEAKQGTKITFFEACSMFFQERLKSNPRVAEAFKSTVLIAVFKNVESLGDKLDQLTPTKIAELTSEQLAVKIDSLVAMSHEQQKQFSSLEKLLNRQKLDLAGFYLFLTSFTDGLGTLIDRLASTAAKLESVLASANDNALAIHRALESLTSGSSSPAPGIKTAIAILRSRPLHCFGREVDIDQLTTWLLNSESGGACLLGPGGIGKSTVALESMHNPKVSDRFQKNRFFVACDSVTDASSLWYQIAQCMGLAAVADHDKEVVSHIAENQSLLVLDNLESVWESPYRTTIEVEVLSPLASIKGCKLIVSARGDSAPSHCNWSYVSKLRTLDINAALLAFNAVAGKQFEGEKGRVENFLEEKLGCLPLAVFLFGCVAQSYDSFADLEAVWAKKRTGMLVRDGEANRHANIEVSFELSLSCLVAANTPLPRQILDTIARFPHGIARADVTKIWDADAVSAVAILIRLGLVYVDSGRLRILAPLREYLTKKNEPSTTVYKQAFSYFESLAIDLGSRIGSQDSEEAFVRLGVEANNIWASLRQQVSKTHRAIWKKMKAKDQESLARLLVAVDNFGVYQSISGFGSYDLLIEARSFAEKRGLRMYEANLAQRMADTAIRRSDYALACDSYRAALSMFKELGFYEGHANCVQKLGVIEFIRSNHDTAVELLTRAEALHAEAELSVPHRRQVHQKGRGISLRVLADIAFLNGDLELAQSKLMSASELFQKVNYVKGMADCRLRQLDISRLSGASIQDLQSQLTELIRVYESVSDPSGVAHCHLAQGELEQDIALARKHIEEAWKSFRERKDKHGELLAACRLAEKLLASGDLESCRSLFAGAFELAESGPYPRSLAIVASNLVLVSADEAEQHYWSSRAKDRLLELKRVDLVEAYFPD